MNLDETRKRLTELSNEMDSASDAVVEAATKAQQEIYDALVKQITYFETKNGRFVSNQDVSERIIKIERAMRSLIGKNYTPSLADYFAAYTTIDDTTAYLHKSYNELVIEKGVYTSARRAIYDQAEYWLTKGVADAYVQPVKYLLMQAVNSGITIKQAESLIRNWNDGELKAGSRLASGRPTPRLQAYAGQMARDSIHQYNGVIQDKIGQQYGLTKFLYVGGLVKDSRPFCKHLVSLKRKIELDEVPPLVEKYPDGLIPNTTKANFPQYRGGYNCFHTVMMVR